MQLPKAPFYRRWSVLLAGVRPHHDQPAADLVRADQDDDLKGSGRQSYPRGGYGQLLVESVCKRWKVTVLFG